MSWIVTMFRRHVLGETDRFEVQPHDDAAMHRRLGEIAQAYPSEEPRFHDYEDHPFQPAPVFAPSKDVTKDDQQDHATATPG